MTGSCESAWWERENLTCDLHIVTFSETCLQREADVTFTSRQDVLYNFGCCHLKSPLVRLSRCIWQNVLIFLQTPLQVHALGFSTEGSRGLMSYHHLHRSLLSYPNGEYGYFKYYSTHLLPDSSCISCFALRSKVLLLNCAAVGSIRSCRHPRWLYCATAGQTMLSWLPASHSALKCISIYCTCCCSTTTARPSTSGVRPEFLGILTTARKRSSKQPLTRND